MGIGSVGIACLVCARLVAADARLALALDTVALAALAYAEAHALHGAPLVAALSGTGVALAGAVRPQRFGLAAASGFLALAALLATAIEAPPSALAFGVDDLAAAAAALAAVGAASLAVARLIDGREPGPVRTGFVVAGSLALLYLASVAVVTAFQPSAETLDTGFALGVRQQGQVLLSGMWALVGVVALTSGLRRDRLELRSAGFALLALAFGKVVVFDLSTLDSIYRVASCVALGLLLLGSAFAYQRLRPRVRVR
jgi:hypothetical protein